MRDLSRRRFVAGSTVVAVAALAGCGGNGGGDDGGMEETPTPTEGTSDAEQRVTDYLNADPPADNFGGTIADKTGMDEVAVKVGAAGNGGNFAFAPPAMKISVNTTVSWQWTGEGGEHNVVSHNDSDFDFKSGDPKASGDPFEQSFDNTGVGLYLCEPHESLGMKGGFVVVE